jgi:hypothetical protein
MARMSDRKLSVYPCPEVKHNVKVTYFTKLDKWKRRALSQTIVMCNYRIENLCTVELYPEDGDSKCPAVKLARVCQFK